MNKSEQINLERCLSKATIGSEIFISCIVRPDGQLIKRYPEDPFINIVDVTGIVVGYYRAFVNLPVIGTNTKFIGQGPITDFRLRLFPLLLGFKYYCYVDSKHMIVTKMNKK